MRKTKPLEKESQTIHKPNQLLNTETTQLLYEKILVSHPELNDKEFNQIIKNIEDCLSSLTFLFKSIPSTIRQIGVESNVHGKQKNFYFQLSKIETDEFVELLAKDKYRIEFDEVSSCSNNTILLHQLII